MTDTKEAAKQCAYDLGKKYSETFSSNAMTERLQQRREMLVAAFMAGVLHERMQRLNSGDAELYSTFNPFKVGVR